MKRLNMMRLVGGVLIVVAVLDCLLITAAMGLATQERSTQETASVNWSERSEGAAMSVFNRPDTQGGKEMMGSMS